MCEMKKAVDLFLICALPTTIHCQYLSVKKLTESLKISQASEYKMQDNKIMLYCNWLN